MFLIVLRLFVPVTSVTVDIRVGQFVLRAIEAQQVDGAFVFYISCMSEQLNAFTQCADAVYSANEFAVSFTYYNAESSTGHAAFVVYTTGMIDYEDRLIYNGTLHFVSQRPNQEFNYAHCWGSRIDLFMQVERGRLRCRGVKRKNVSQDQQPQQFSWLLNYNKCLLSDFSKIRACDLRIDKNSSIAMIPVYNELQPASNIGIYVYLGFFALCFVFSIVIIKL